MSNAYLINLTKTTVIGRFDTMELAEEHAKGGCFEFTIVEDAGDIESQLKRDEMVTIYNQVTRASLKKFANKNEGALRTFEALENTKFLMPKKEQPVKPTPEVKHPQSKAAVAQVWAIADELDTQGQATRANLLAHAELAGINLNTAKTQWQKWRKANL